jgi:hypothetical protein
MEAVPVAVVPPGFQGVGAFGGVLVREGAGPLARRFERFERSFGSHRLPVRLAPRA